MAKTIKYRGLKYVEADSHTLIRQVTSMVTDLDKAYSTVNSVRERMISLYQKEAPKELSATLAGEFATNAVAAMTAIRKVNKQAESLLQEIKNKPQSVE